MAETKEENQDKTNDDDLELQPAQADEPALVDFDINNDNEDINSDSEESSELSEPGESNDLAETLDIVVMPKSKVALIKKLLENIKENNERLLQLLSCFITSEAEENISIGQMSDEKFESSETETTAGRVIEGVFDGEKMIGPDGKQYSVPANYASKSKLVEGDILKLIITAKGTFIYKQIGPIERSRVIGRLEKTNDGGYFAAADGKKWRVLTASVTYFKGETGDEIVILIPKTGESKWAAVENLVRTSE